MNCHNRRCLSLQIKGRELNRCSKVRKQVFYDVMTLGFELIQDIGQWTMLIKIN